MSEQHASVRGGSTRSSRLTRRLRKGRGTRIEDPDLKEERDRLFRAKMLLKINEQKDSGQEEEAVPAGPSIQGRGRSEELQQVLNDKRREEQTRVVQRQQHERELAEKARAKLTHADNELLKDPPEPEKFEPEEAIPETDIPEKADTAEKRPDGTVVLPRRTSNRARRSVILKVDGSELVKPSGSQRTEAAAPNAPKRTRFVFKVLGTLLLLFIGILCYRWIATGRSPSDLASVEGQRELASETEETVSWAMQDLKKLLGGNAPETKEDTAKLLDESKEEIKASEKKTADAAPKPPAAKAVTPSPVLKKPAVTSPARQPERNAGPAPRYFAEKNPLLNAARDAFQQANVYHAKSDPRVADFDSVQKNIRIAIPLFERCLDECAKARQRGFKGAEVDVLEQAAAMRLYDCRKRETVNP